MNEQESSNSKYSCEKNDTKILRNSGQAYTNKKGKLIMKKEPPTEVSCKCKFSCETVKLNDRQILWKEFYKLANYDKQQSYLRNFIQVSPVRQRRGGFYDDPAESRRQKTFKYFLPLPCGGKARVCQKTFRDTFALKPGRVQHLALKIASGHIDVADNRGGRKNFETPDWNTRIKDHINSFPTEKSHCNYCNSKNYSYLSPDLNLSLMFEHFQDIYRDPNTQDNPPVSRTLYCNTFRKRFNLSFKRPSITDPCQTCNDLQIAIDNVGDEGPKEAAVLSQYKHHAKVEASQRLLKSDIRNSDYYVVCFDLDQQIVLPTFVRSQMYRYRQLNCYNLGIHDERRKKGIICLWTEDRGGCGSVEIGSCLYQYFTEEPITSDNKLVLWSDKCAGEDGSYSFIAMYMMLIAKGFFEEITHKFLIKGHTYTSCSRDFELIEKKKRGAKFFTVKDIAQLIQGATEKKPFQVMLIDGFVEWESIVSNAFLKTDGLQIDEVAQIRITRENFGYVNVSSDYSDNSWENKKILRTDCDISYFQELILEKTNTSEGLSEEKKKDLREMLPYLPEDADKYFSSILDN